MTISKYNAERYYDPTAYEALTRIEREERISQYRPLVYICSPYAGDVDRNVAAARRYSRIALELGCIPLAPHLLFPQFLDDRNEEERALGLRFGNILMDKCAELWVFGSRISSGMEAEIKRAGRKGYPVRYFTEGGTEYVPEN